MPLTTDALLDRKRLKAQAVKWRNIAVVALIVLLLLQSSDWAGLTSYTERDYIARIRIADFISEDKYRDDMLAAIKKDKHAKAIILEVDSPGGTVVGGEMLYNNLRDIASNKPMVTVMQSVAASGGYMVAIASDYILAQRNTLTGSIGVILQTAEVTELAQKLGVTLITFKSGPLKASPSPFEKVSSEVRRTIDASIQDSFHYFLDLVKTRRKLTPATILLISDGRVFTGNQALRVNLVDAIGGSQEAVDWLAKNRKIPATLPIKDISLKKKKPFWQEYADSFIGDISFKSKGFSLDGLLAIWHPV